MDAVNQQPIVQQVPVTDKEIYGAMIQEERVRNVIAQISPDNQLYEIEMRIKGYKKNMYTNSWEKIDKNAPDTSAVLVSRYISYLGSILNQNTSMSNISESQVNKIMGLAIAYITDDLDDNAVMYGIGYDYTERTRIGHIILNSTFMVLNRALNGQEAKRMWGSLSMTENNGGFGNNKKGIMDAVKGVFS